MKIVLLPIHPEWCELIAKGIKTVEVRKTKPKQPTPFKVMLYCTKGGKSEKKQGVKAGVSDICLPYPCVPYHGLFIELKVGKNKPTEKQSQWLAELADAGYKTAVCYGWKSAANTILEYLNDPQLSYTQLWEEIERLNSEKKHLEQQVYDLDYKNEYLKRGIPLYAKK